MRPRVQKIVPPAADIGFDISHTEAIRPVLLACRTGSSRALGRRRPGASVLPADVAFLKATVRLSLDGP